MTDEPAGRLTLADGRERPRVETRMTADNEATSRVSGDFGRIDAAAGNPDVARMLLTQLVSLGAPGELTSDEVSNFGIGFLDAMAPRDPAEALLMTQMAATHQATMWMARRLNGAKTLAQQDSAERAMNKLARTFTAQLEALKRYRSKGQQLVRVERVTVNDGGQAIVGSVEAGGRVHDKS
ncbi:hypothetical protein OG2516_04024 [Oceanicola granulosus HTCC2516]|uniref:Uncharacterized protein n=1 Tax=Oceanicola granulosus (strain ATCC BAA-861 / DSM 15982 / KCTC 12143 / HTCC2516) TaxID=314256 RepID=Q2CEG4_OCEGH|nr:hypothetical protein [Oceanicola granulosus]EAR51033.1 hypothetical protein OG2516_04024 [Oceanicola granulosus HTCC2516]